MNLYNVTLKSMTSNDRLSLKVYGYSSIDAQDNACIVIAHSMKYEYYYVDKFYEPYLIEKDCTVNTTNDTIWLYLTKGEIIMANKKWFNVDWKDYVKPIINIAAQETWSNNTYPDNQILVNYMAHTIKKLREDKSIISTDEYAILNTGLFTEFYEPIYAYQTDKGIVFLTEYDLDANIEKLPDRANYFTSPELLLFDWHYDIRIQYEHILTDKENKARLPQEIIDSGNALNIIRGAIENMKRRVSANYKLAIPQYHEKSHQIQLLLPLCLLTNDKPDLALVVTKVGNHYQGHTCLTLDMAYNNARLIAKPESNWLSL